MRVFRKIICAALTTSVLLAASSMSAYAETGTPIIYLFVWHYC